MKKVILKVEYSEDRIKQKAMKSVSGLTGVESIAMDTKDKKLTVIGDIDPVKVVAKLRKLCHTEIISVGPAKEPEKKKEEPKKEEPKKEAPKPPVYVYPPPYYMHGNKTMEEDPNACVIC